MGDLLSETLSGDQISAQLLYLLLLPIVLLFGGIFLLLNSRIKGRKSDENSTGGGVRGDNIGQLERLAKLRSEGALSDGDYEEIKRSMLDPQRRESSRRTRSYGMAAVLGGVVSLVVVGAIILIVSDDGGDASGERASVDASDISSSPTTVSATPTTRPARVTTTTTPLTQLEDWFAENTFSIQPMGAAQEAFEGAIMQQASDDVVGRASIDLYNALVAVPAMPASLPVSREWNAWLNAAISVADRISDGYLNRNTEAMYIAMFEWSDVQRLYRRLFEAMESIYERHS